MVLIKNMEMPKSCAHCSLKNFQYSECNVTHKKVAFWRANNRPENCPLVEIDVDIEEIKKK